MVNTPPLKQSVDTHRDWLYALGWLILIYATLYWVRPACEFLKSCLPFSVLINCLFAVLAIFLLYHFLKRKPHAVTLKYLFFLLLIYGISLKTLPLPEERIHLIEYGILAVLFFRALFHNLNQALSLGLAFILTSVAGVGDELIQGVLPNRYYETKDVWLNAWSGFLGLMLYYTIKLRHH